MRQACLSVALLLGLAGSNVVGATEPRADRGIEESDIYKLVGTTLYVLDRLELQIVDLSDPAAPRLLGRAPLGGVGDALYVREGRAYVIVHDRDTSGQSPLNLPQRGTQLAIVDVADPANPRVVGGINLDGDAVDSRIVGDVMYLVSNRYAYWSRFGQGGDQTGIIAVDLASRDLRVVDMKDVPASGPEQHVFATPNAIYVASSGGAGKSTTEIQYVDISDPAGTIAIRSEASAPGTVHDRWEMDEFAGVLRVASGAPTSGGDAHLTTFDVANPDAIRPIGDFTLHVNEPLTAARFDDAAAYLSTARRIEPLFAFDVSNAQEPRLVGDLETTGWLDFIVPMGDQLVALGHDQVATSDGGQTISLAVSLIDVADLPAPELLSRLTVGDNWGWVPSNRDNFAKVFTVLSEQNLIVFPFQSWAEGNRYNGGVQLIDFDRRSLRARGLIDNAGFVERGIPYTPQMIITVACGLLQTVDITDRDRPRIEGRLELEGDEPCPTPRRADAKSNK